MDALIYVANGLYLMAYTVRDILHLRLLSVTAALCLMGYFASRPEPMLEVVCWNGVFLVLNLVQIARLIAARLRRGRRAASSMAGAIAPTPSYSGAPSPRR